MRKNIIVSIFLSILVSLPAVAIANPGGLNTLTNLNDLTVDFINKNATTSQKQKIQSLCNGNVDEPCIEKIKGLVQAHKNKSGIQAYSSADISLPWYCIIGPWLICAFD